MYEKGIYSLISWEESARTEKGDRFVERLRKSIHAIEVEFDQH
jgi:hypothetical protein